MPENRGYAGIPGKPRVPHSELDLCSFFKPLFPLQINMLINAFDLKNVSPKWSRCSREKYHLVLLGLVKVAPPSPSPGHFLPFLTSPRCPRCPNPSSPLGPRCALAFSFLRCCPNSPSLLDCSRVLPSPCFVVSRCDRRFYSPTKIGAVSGTTSCSSVSKA